MPVRAWYGGCGYALSSMYILVHRDETDLYSGYCNIWFVKQLYEEMAPQTPEFDRRGFGLS